MLTLALWCKCMNYSEWVFFHVLSALFQYVSKAVIMNKEERIRKDEPLSAPTFRWSYLLCSNYDRGRRSRGRWLQTGIYSSSCLVSADRLSPSILEAPPPQTSPFIIRPITISHYFMCVPRLLWSFLSELSSRSNSQKQRAGVLEMRNIKKKKKKFIKCYFIKLGDEVKHM